MSEYRWGVGPESQLPVVAGYTILGRIGAGGMGEVYRAREGSLGREVALKLTPKSRLSPAAEARFQREAELLARFQHPGVIRVHTWGQTPEFLFLECELVQEAKTFAEACAGYDDLASLALGRELCEVLRALHEAGVVHRDVKPENVLVTPSGSIKLVDFGIAAAEDLQRLTQSGTFVGTPLYSAPERIRFQGERADPAADVWSVAAMLYEVLTGRLPFAASSFIGMVAATSQRPLRVAELRPDLPSWVALALDRALSLDPRARPSAADLARALEGDAMPAPRRGRAWAAIGLIGAALGGAVWAWSALNPGTQAPPASPFPALAASPSQPPPASPSPSLAASPPPSAPSLPSPTPRISREEANRALASQDRQAAARLVMPLLAEGSEDQLAAVLGEGEAAELIALGLLPPIPEAVELPPEWRLLGERLGAGRPGLTRAVEAAMRARPWSEILEIFTAAEAVEPEAPWWLLRGLLARELLIPFVAPRQAAQSSGPWALEDWRIYLRVLGLRPSERSQQLQPLAERTSDPLLRSLALARIEAETSEPTSATSERAGGSGRLGIRARLLERGAGLQTPLFLVSSLNGEAAHGLHLYAELLSLRKDRILNAIQLNPTRLGFRAARRFVTRSLETLRNSPRSQHALLDSALRLPALRGLVQVRAKEASERWPAAAEDFKVVAAFARGLAPVPADLSPPPEWQERVAGLEPAARPGVRRAVELGICGRPWIELEAELKAARRAAPSEEGVPIARALLAVARCAQGVVTLEDLCEDLTPPWRELIRARWLLLRDPPDWVPPTGDSEHELEFNLRPANFKGLRELAPRHSQAAFLLRVTDLPRALTPELFESVCLKLEPLLEQTGALYAENLVPRLPSALGLAQKQAGLARRLLERTLRLVPDGPAVLMALRSSLPPAFFRSLLLDWAPNWPLSPDAQGQAGCLWALSGHQDQARDLILRAQGLDPDWRPPVQLLSQLRSADPELCAERFGPE